MNQHMNILSACALFRGMSRQDLESILACLGARTRRFARGETILREGDPADQLGIVLSGSAQIVRMDYYGSRSIVASVAPGQLFGETFAYALVSAMPVSVVASSECEALLIAADRISSPCAKACSFHNQMIFNLLHVLAAKNLMFTRKSEITAQRTTRGKLMAYLMQEAKKSNSSTFSIPYDRQELADYLGVDRSGLSAEISRLRREGVLSCTKNKFILLRPDDTAP